MKKISDFYAYSKDKSSSVLNLKKKEINKTDKQYCWLKNIYSKFEETKKETFEYLYEKQKQWKINFSSITLPYFKFNHSKYGNYPWYKKLYYLIRDQIYSLLKITDSKIAVVRSEKNVNENKISREFASDKQFDNKVKQVIKNPTDSVFYKYSSKLKKNKENDIYFGERSQSELIKRNMSGRIIPIRLNGNMVGNSILKDTSSFNNINEEDFCDAKETKEMDSNIDYSTENSHFLNVVNSPKFNIKNTWEKLSGLIS